MLSGKYHLKDIVRQLDRDKSTIIRWEEQGLIPRAPRDSRGWRFYSERDVRKIVALVKRTNYFQDDGSGLQHKHRRHKAGVITVGVIVLLMVSNLIGLGLKNVMAFTNQTTTLYQTVNAGILDIVAASSSQAFNAVTVTFVSQSSTADLGAFNVADARGSGAGWTVNLTGTDWNSGSELGAMNYAGKGTDDNHGNLCVVVSAGAIESQAGQDTTNVTLGGADCFSNATTIDLVTASSSFGKGDYYITDLTLSQFIPSNPTAQEYTTTLTMTIS